MNRLWKMLAILGVVVVLMAALASSVQASLQLVAVGAPTGGDWSQEFEVTGSDGVCQMNIGVPAGNSTTFSVPPVTNYPSGFTTTCPPNWGAPYYVSATGESLFDYDTTNSNGWDNVSPIFYFTMNFPGTTTSDPDPSFTFEAYSAPGGNRFPNGAADIVASYQLTYNDGSWNITAYTPTDQFAPWNGGETGNGAVVPEPATVLVWSLLGASSWLGVRVVRRGRRSSRPWTQENRTAILDIIAKR